MLHVMRDMHPLMLGDGVTVGHGVILRMHDRVALLDWNGIDHFERSEDRGGINYRRRDVGAGADRGAGR